MLNKIDEKEIKSIALNNIEHTDYNIVQDNNLIEAMYDLDEKELKVFLAVVSLISKEDNALSWYKLTTSELCTLCGIPKKNGKRKLDSLRESLMRKVFYIHQTVTEDGKSKDVVIEYHFFRGIMFNEEFWYLRLSDDLAPFVLCLKKNFTTEKLSDVRGYDSSLAVRLDMIFTMYYKKETSKMSLENKLKYLLTVSYSTEDFRNMLLLGDKHKEFKSLNTRVLKPAINDINQRGFFHVEMKKVLNHKHQVNRIMFYVSLGEKHEYYQKTTEKIKEMQQAAQLKNKVAYVLEIVGFDKESIEYILKKNELENIVIQLKAMDNLNLDSNKEQKEYLNAHLKTKEHGKNVLSSIIATLSTQ